MRYTRVCLTYLICVFTVTRIMHTPRKGTCMHNVKHLNFYDVHTVVCITLYPVVYTCRSIFPKRDAVNVLQKYNSEQVRIV